MSRISIAMPEIKVNSPARRAPFAGHAEDIEFGRHFTPNFFVMEFNHGTWENARVVPLSDISLHPAAMVFHYCQAMFEGLKAFRLRNEDIALFRPFDHARRLNRSAQRLDMPTIPETFFVDAISELIKVDQEHVLPAPASLYIRPTMIGTEPLIKVASSNTFTFFILTAVTGPYFKGASQGALRVFVTRSATRASIGGTGNIKAGANYANTLQITTTATKKFGCHQVLFLDARNRENVEEMGGMNIFFVRNGSLITPKLDAGTILQGITRDCVKTLAKEEFGLTVIEEDLPLSEVLTDFASGRISEAFASGTAASVAGIGEFCLENLDGSQDPTTFLTPNPVPGPITTRLFTRLKGIQYGESPDPYHWLHPVLGRQQ